MQVFLPEYKMKCRKCKHKWIPRTEAPIKCPRCGKIIKDPLIIKEAEKQ